MKKLIIWFVVFGILLPISLLAEETKSVLITDEKITRPTIRVINTENFSKEFDFHPFAEDSLIEGINITTADLNGDNKKEIIVAAGRNEKPYVKIFNHLGQFQYQFLAYDENYNKGLKVVVADLFNDNLPEIITAPEIGGGPQIRVFDNMGNIYFGFFAFDQNLRGGCSVAVGDVNGDKLPEIVVGAGFGQEPIVKIYDRYSTLLKEFLVYDQNFTGGVNLLTADLDKDKRAEIITAPAIAYKPLVKIFNYTEAKNEFMAYPSGFWGGVNLAASDVDQDGYLDILTGAGFSGGAHLRFFDQLGNPKIHPSLFVFENFKGGISIADGDLDNDGQTEIVAATQTISPINKYDSYKIIEIDLSKQKLYTYFKGLPVTEKIVSTGRWQFPTPEGNFRIYAKVPSTTMTGYYGEDHPENYELPDVPHVMPFYKDYAIHGAYWHFNFGTRVSHGCVNLKLPDAQEIYEWTDVGVPVNIYSSK